MRTTTVGADPVSPADQATVRRMNLALLMRTLTSGGPRPRSRLAEETGLTKATVSSLVAELGDRGLVTEGVTNRGGVGRPARLVEVNREVVRCVGLELTVDYISGLITDLTGRVLGRRHTAVPVKELGPARALGAVADLARSLVDDARSDPSHVETLCLSIPGLVDATDGILSYAPNLNWHEVDVGHALAGRLRWNHVRVLVDNDANLGAVAEYSAGRSAGSANLVYVLGGIGVGAGLVLNGQIVRGASGFAGEIGHMPVGPADAVCGCGRSGCWETAVGLRALLDATATNGAGAVADADLNSRLAGIVERMAAGEKQTTDAVADVARWLGQGLSVVANLLDPEVIVLGGHFATLRDYLGPIARAELGRRVMTPRSACRLEFSDLGYEAAALGAAYCGIEVLLKDPTLVTLASAG